VKIIWVLFLFLNLCVLEISAQTEVPPSISDSTKLTNYTPPKYFDVNHRFIFEYGLMFCLTREEDVVSTLSASYDISIISKKLYGSIQLGAFFGHGEEKDGAGWVIGFGFDYSVYTGGKYNLSIYAGAQAMLFNAVFGVVHIRNTFMISTKGALTLGLRYLPQIGARDHWLMPTFGYQLFLK